MSNTVPADLPRMFRPEPKLSAVPAQPTARERETLPTERTWTFIDRRTGKPQTVTCMSGCVLDHSDDDMRAIHPDDWWCQTETTEVWLPMEIGGKPEEARVLSSDIRWSPFSTKMSERLPYASVEVVEEQHLGPLDPDGLAVAIVALEGQLKLLRDMHAQLSALRKQAGVQL